MMVSLARILFVLFLVPPTGGSAQPTALAAPACPGPPLLAAGFRAGSVFEIVAESPFGVGRGTAFAVAGREGRTVLATSGHVVHAAGRIRARRGAGDWVPADLVANYLETNPGADLALIAIPGDYPPIPFAGDIAPGWAAVIGHGPGPLRAETGEIRRVRRDGRGRPRLIELRLRLRPGDSGAPILDRCGQAFGIATAVTDDEAGEISYAVPLDRGLLAAAP